MRHPRALIRVLVALAALAVALSAAAVHPATSFAGGDNVAIEVNTKDGSSVFDLAFSVRRVTGDVVDQANAAVAVSSCEECQTTALALQVLLIQSDAEVISPINLALAMNVECSTCVTVALAYQYVLGTGERLRFTAEGERRIAEIRRKFNRLRRLGLTLPELIARVDELRRELEEVLRTELVPVGPESRGGPPEDERSAGEPAPRPPPEQSPPQEEPPPEETEPPTTPTEPPPEEGTTTEPESTTAPAPSG